MVPAKIWNKQKYAAYDMKEYLHNYNSSLCYIFQISLLIFIHNNNDYTIENSLPFPILTPLLQNVLDIKISFIYIDIYMFIDTLFGCMLH